MKLFKDNFKLELFSRQLFVKQPKQKKGEYEVTITRTYNSYGRYQVNVFLAGKKIDRNFYIGKSAFTKFGCREIAKKMIKQYEKSIKKDEVVHRLYI